MAVSEIKNPSSLKIKLNLGLVDGKAKTRSKSYSYLKHDVTDIIKIDNTTLNA